MKKWIKDGCWGVIIVMIVAIIIWLIWSIIYKPELNYLFQPLALIAFLPGIIIVSAYSFKTWGYETPNIFWTSPYFGALISVVTYFILGVIVGAIIRKLNLKRFFVKK